MPRILLILALCAAAVFGGPAAALHADRPVRLLRHVWYREQLPQNTVLSIAQRRDGSMWFATYAGLVRYSGAGFETVHAPALTSTAVTALLEDRAGTLWVGTLNGGLYRDAGRGFEPVALPEPLDSVLTMTEDASGALWLATNAGVARRTPDGDLRVFDTDDGVPRVPYRALAADRDGAVWIAVDGMGVVRHSGGRIERFGLEHGLPSLATYAVRVDEAGVVWVGTQNGVVRWRSSGAQAPGEARFERPDALAPFDGKRIYAIEGDRDGNLWISAQETGLCRYNARGLECRRGMRGLAHDIVRSVAEDREGNLWFGATNSGLHRLSDSKLVTITGALDSNSVRVVYEDARGTLWAGTDGGGVARVAGDRLVAAEFNARLPSPFTRALGGDAAGNLWVGTIEGLSRVTPDGAVTTYDTASGLPGNIVFAIAPRAAGGVWAGTTLGLVYVDGGVPQQVAAAGPTDIRALFEDPGGRLWIGQRSGIHCLDGAAIDTCGTDGLDDSSVFAFHRAADGAMWLGTSKGLARLHGTALRRYTKRDGLADDVVFTILEDRLGAFWLSSNGGITRVYRRDLETLAPAGRVAATLFGKDDGMLSSQGNGASQSPGWVGRDGRVWIATAHGVVLVDPADLRANALPPLVAIERVVVDGRGVDAAAGATLGPGVDRLEFHYAGMSYVAPEAVRYRYRLEGYDREWVDAADRRVAFYTNLPPGDYTFRARAANDDGVWSEADARVAFAIAPHFHETWLFRALVALAAAALVALAWRVRLGRVRANELELTRLIAEKTAELREANKELTRLASLDGLTRIANRGAFDRALSRLWDEHRRSATPLAVLLCDIDAFKAYNDSYGHQAGDAALKSVAATLLAHASGPDDVAARYGGEEFALVLGNRSLPDALAVATKLLAAVRDLAIPHRGSPVTSFVTLSIGVASMVPKQGTTLEELIRAADEALYRAKAEGRNRAVAAV